MSATYATEERSRVQISAAPARASGGPGGGARADVAGGMHLAQPLVSISLNFPNDEYMQAYTHRR